jgi:hypothetical protein
MECKVLDKKAVSTRFGERLLITVSHPDGVQEIWLNGNDPVQVGDTVNVEVVNGKLRLVKNKKPASSSERNNGDGDAVAELVTLFKAIRDALPDEPGEAIAKLAITLFLRK